VGAIPAAALSVPPDDDAWASTWQLDRELAGLHRPGDIGQHQH